MLAFLAQGGAGLYVWSGGVANLDGCNVFSNEAQVRAPVPGPSLQRSAGTFRVLAFLAQYGAGLMIEGTATLTNTNVYTNQAEVRAHLPPFPRPFLQRPAELTVRPPFAGYLLRERWPNLEPR